MIEKILKDIEELQYLLKKIKNNLTTYQYISEIDRKTALKQNEYHDIDVAKQMLEEYENKEERVRIVDTTEIA